MSQSNHGTPEHAQTPLMRQYLEIKSQYPDAILFFQLGDFYEMFFDDAIVAAQALELCLTSRDRNKENPTPMCGVPHHAAKNYIHKLLERGFKVAICDQVQDPRLAKGIVQRQVTQVVTPGVIFDADHLDAKSNNYLMSVVMNTARDASAIGVAVIDISTSELSIAALKDDASLADELARICPKELICNDGAQDALAELCARSGIGNVVHATFDVTDHRRICDLLDQRTQQWRTCPDLSDEKSPVRAAAAMVLAYVEQTQPGRALPVCQIVAYHDSEHLQLDESTLRNLELFTAGRDGRKEGALLHLLDQTQTAMGGRLLRNWLARPLYQVNAISRRHDAVQWLVENAAVRKKIREVLQTVYDLQRLTVRAAVRLATPRELHRLGVSLQLFPQLVSALNDTASSGAQALSSMPDLIAAPADIAQDVAQIILRAFVDDPPLLATEGGIFVRGHHADLDELLSICDGGLSEIAAIEQRERAQTGIGSLKVRYNKVFGYYIEITRTHLKSVPAHYQRKQTVANAERYITEELSTHEQRVVGAQERRCQLEFDLFVQLRDQIAHHADRLQRLSEWIGRLDVLSTFAELAQRHNYVRPTINTSREIHLVESRHPVVERFMKSGQFVPNDITLEAGAERMLILTGPNMAGKSTIMRQVALNVLMAQMGAFVPCRSCTIGVVDRIFTRVGASDNLCRGESTFMVEMRETADILRSATSKSLIVMDEIGRGTSTYDGVSIAWAVAEFLHDQIKARTLFATHYHELCQLVETKPHAANYTVSVQQWQGDIVFLHKLVAGGANRSYGIEVARLAGINPSIIRRAQQVLLTLENAAAADDSQLTHRAQLELFHATSAPSINPIVAQLAELDPNNITPLQALAILSELHATVVGN